MLDSFSETDKAEGLSCWLAGGFEVSVPSHLRLPFPISLHTITLKQNTYIIKPVLVQESHVSKLI